MFDGVRLLNDVASLRARHRRQILTETAPEIYAYLGSMSDTIVPHYFDIFIDEIPNVNGVVKARVLGRYESRAVGHWPPQVYLMPACR
jgi:hypothetical protein